MSAVFQCDLCGGVSADICTKDEYCPDCDIKIARIRSRLYSEIAADFEKKFGTTTAKQVQVMNLLTWLQKGNHKYFVECFGTQGSSLLEAAVTQE